MLPNGIQMADAHEGLDVKDGDLTGLDIRAWIRFCGPGATSRNGGPKSVRKTSFF